MQVQYTDTTKLLNNIIRIVDKTGINIPFIKIEYKNQLLIDGKPVSKRSANRIVYICPRCEKECTIRLTTLGSKIRRGYQGCKYCFTNHVNIQIPDIQEAISDEYFKKELTKDDFEYIKPHILSVQNHKFTDLTYLEYIPIVQYGNICKSMLYDTKRDVYEDLTNITLICEKCNGQFKIKQLNEYKNNRHIYCKECKRIKSVKVGVIHGVYFKTRFESKFIEMVKQQNIQIENKDGKLYLPQLDRQVVIVHKKFKKKKIPNAIYSDELKQQVDIIKKQIDKEAYLLINK